MIEDLVTCKSLKDDLQNVVRAYMQTEDIADAGFRVRDIMLDLYNKEIGGALEARGIIEIELKLFDLIHYCLNVNYNAADRDPIVTDKIVRINHILSHIQVSNAAADNKVHTY